METFLIGELARRAGVNKETVRYYESRGLLDPPKRRESGIYREYTGETVLQIKIIRQLKQLGFTLGEIKLLFELYDNGARECDDFTGAMETKIDSIESELSRLKGVRTTLRKMHSKCEKGGLLKACLIWDKLMRSEFLEENL